MKVINTNNPTPHLFFRIENKDGDTYTLDRNIPDTYLDQKFINFKPKIGEELYGEYPSDYVFPSDEITLFLNNYSCEIQRFPYWMLSIIITKNIPGVEPHPNRNDKSYLEYDTTAMSGFVNYIQNHKKKYDMLAVIHYTNPSPANVYGEGFNEDSLEIYLPTLMWHRPNKSGDFNSSTLNMGAKFKASPEKKLMFYENPHLNIFYYDLIDEDNYVIGKVFNGLKMIVIEDQEIIFALSYKSNRNWTLPKPNLYKGEVIPPSEPITTTIEPVIEFDLIDVPSPLVSIESNIYDIETVVPPLVSIESNIYDIEDVVSPLVFIEEILE